jgi:vacuolar-type H+-ATPase subunit H
MAGQGNSVSDQVAAILRAAEESAEQIRQEAETRLRARIAEADRAAENRVKAAEDEAAEIIRGARGDAENIRKDAVARAQSEADRVRMEADELKENATSEALAIVARAQENADETLTDAHERAREMLSDARLIAGEVQADGQLLASQVRELGDSMRSNADRLLRDVQAVHSTFLAQVDKLDPSRSALGPGPTRTNSRSSTPRGGTSATSTPTRAPGEDLEVPEFIPRA